MNSSAYFASRHQIISWINHVTQNQLTKIEQLGSGNIYCQILDAAYPEKVPIHKVKWNAYLEVDFLHNFKILQTSFERLGISKTINIQKLVKAKYQDNLQFIQWMKWFLADKIKENQPYNANARRGFNEVYLLFTDKKPAELKNSSNIYEKQNKLQKETKIISSMKENIQISCELKSMVSNDLKTQRSMQLADKDKKIGKNDQKQIVNDIKPDYKQKQNAGLQLQKLNMMKKVKKSKIEVTTRSKHGLTQKKINQNMEQQQQCF